MPKCRGAGSADQFLIVKKFDWEVEGRRIFHFSFVISGCLDGGVQDSTKLLVFVDPGSTRESVIKFTLQTIRSHTLVSFSSFKATFNL